MLVAHLTAVYVKFIYTSFGKERQESMRAVVYLKEEKKSLVLGEKSVEAAHFCTRCLYPLCQDEPTS